MTPTRGIEAYRRTEIESANPLELVVLLYDGALRFAAQTRDAVIRGDVPARREATSRALAILSELQSTLDMERGGAIASSLEGLYVFVSGELVNGATRQEPETIDRAVRILQTLREAWATLATNGAQAARAAVPR